MCCTACGLESLIVARCSAIPWQEFCYAHGLVDGAQRDAMARNVSRFDAALAAGNLSLATDVEHGIEHFCTGAAGVNAYARLADPGE